MERLFYVSAGGEPLGVMTMTDAFTWAFAHGHVTLYFENLETKQKTEK